MHPTIYYTKKMIKIFCEEREVALFCDMHGHSIKKNVFMYACSHKKPSIQQFKENVFIRLVPYLLSKSNQFFDYETSHFRVEKSKQATARVVNFKEFNILASYTLEASFFGSEKVCDRDEHLDISDLESIGRDLCKLLTIFSSPKEFRNKLQNFSEYLKLTQVPRKMNKNTSKKEYLSKQEKNPLVIEKTQTFEEKDEVEPSETKNLTIEDTLKSFDENLLSGIYFPEENSDSGGSDMDASLNDEKKIKFVLEKVHKNSRKKTEIKEEIPSQGQNFSQARITCLTPDLIIKNRPRSRISFRKKSEVLYKKITPTRILLRSPFLEENSEDYQKYSAMDLNKYTGRSTAFKESVPIKGYRRFNDFAVNMSLEDGVFNKSIRKPTEKYIKR